MQNNKTLLIDLHYLPCIEVFCLFSKYDKITIESKEHFIKQTYRNRCHILSANKIMPLIIPIKHKTKKIIIGEAEIDYSQKWQNQHLGAIESSYRKAPFFDHYFDRFHKLYQEKNLLLFEFNFKILTLCLDILHFNKDIDITSYYEEKFENAAISDNRQVIVPKISYNKREFYKPEPYFQIFGKGFVPNLSILDLIFCEGPGSGLVISNSCKL